MKTKTVGDAIKYVHGTNDNRFFEGVDEHDAVITEIIDGKVTKIAILNSEGDPTIPVSRVKHKKEAAEGEVHWK